MAAASSTQNPHINYGAMVNGPTLHDVFNDNRTFASQAGVHLDTTAGFSGDLSLSTCPACVMRLLAEL